MKTNNFRFELMQSNTTNKDITYNENILKIDNLISNSIASFEAQEPTEIKVGEKYIITSGEKDKHICFKPFNNKATIFIEPTDGMIFFVRSENAFFIFKDGNWNAITQSISGAIVENNQQNNQQISISSNTLLTGDEKFTGVQDTYNAPEDHEFLHLYINNNVEINLDQVKTRLVTMIIKNHYQSPKALKWPHNILWENKKPHVMTNLANATDIIRIYRLIETNHFLGEVIGQNYQF